MSWTKSRKDKMMQRTSWLRDSAVVFFFLFFTVAVPVVDGCRSFGAAALGSIFLISGCEGRDGRREEAQDNKPFNFTFIFQVISSPSLFHTTI